MCGIVGLIGPEQVTEQLYNALCTIQHRGQDAAGIATYDELGLHTCKGNGLVRDVLLPAKMRKLTGRVGLGHVRYPTAGTLRSNESQPFYVNSPFGLSLVHNGNLTNADELRADLEALDLRHLNTHSDSEVLLNVIAHELSVTATADFEPAQLFAALEVVYQRVEGAYSCLLMIKGQGMLAFRDPLGIRPLVHGAKQTESGQAHFFASESIGLDSLGYDLLGDVEPGMAVFISESGEVYRHQCVETPTPAPCLFEYVYLSRTDSILNGISVYAARRLMGQYLGEKIQRECPDHAIDVVIPIPDTSRTSALVVAETIGAAYSEGFVKNRYIGRTFIMPGQEARQQSIAMKLNAIKQEFEGKRVLLVDDSIVRGNTATQIASLARKAGAKEVYFASASPAVEYPNVYGIDMPRADDLVAHNRSVNEIAEKLCVEKLFYQSLDDLKRSVNGAKQSGEPYAQFEDSIFTGNYLAGSIDEAYLGALSAKRGSSSADTI